MKERMATEFADLGLSEPVLRAIGDSGYTTPTPIQEKAIPFVMMNRDVLGCAQTGTGKTASFTLPMIDILAQGRGRARMPRSVILEPTRELAAQVSENFDKYGKYNQLNMALLIGGVSFSEQEAKINRGVDVLIATPGRLMDHCERGKVILTDVKILVIDEADRMLDMGFIPDVEKIVSLMPPLRQTLMFSATMPKEIRKLAEKFLSNPKEVTVAPPASTADTIAQKLIRIDSRRKRKTLYSLLEDDTIQNALVFCNRKREVAALYRALEQAGFSAGALHGDMDQYKRLEWLEKFRKNEITVLVCSDVAARGLDIPTVSHVFNYDVPTHAEDYVHRIGRTGRAGRQGASITLCTDADAKYLDAIEKLIGKPIPVSGEAPRKPDPTAKPDTEDAADGSDDEGRDDKPKRQARSKSRETEDTGNRGKGRSSRDRGRGRANDNGRSRDDDEAVPDISDKPFGKSDQVPAFLLRAR
jgi:superfamily II DNA/RNA helicase